jgi:hypothetical protein
MMIDGSVSLPTDCSNTVWQHEAGKFRVSIGLAGSRAGIRAAYKECLFTNPYVRSRTAYASPNYAETKLSLVACGKLTVREHSRLKPNATRLFASDVIHLSRTARVTKKANSVVFVQTGRLLSCDIIAQSWAINLCESMNCTYSSERHATFDIMTVVISIRQTWLA